MAPDYHWLFDAFALKVGSRTPGVQAAIGRLAPGARVLDAACGIGIDALSLARRGYRVTGADASLAMVDHCRERLVAAGAEVPLVCCPWDALAEHFGPEFDAVLCLGNSLSHSPSEGARRRALAAFAAVLDPPGTLLMDLQDWEVVHAAGSRVDRDPQVVARDGVECRRRFDWRVPERLGDPLELEITLDLRAADGERRSSHTVTFRPFTRADLLGDLEVAGFGDVAVHQDPDHDRYTVVAHPSTVTRRG